MRGSWSFFSLALVALSCASPDHAAPIKAPPPPGHDAGAAAPAKVELFTLSPELVQSHFSEGSAAQAAAHYARDEFALARDKFRAAMASAGQEDKVRLEFLVGVTSVLLEDWQSAATALESSLDRMPLFADWIHAQLARAHYRLGHRDLSLEHAKQVDPTSIRGPETALLLGDLYRDRGQWAEAVELYRDYLADEDRTIRRQDARYRLGQALAKLGQEAEAAAAFRSITVHDPMSPWAERAGESLAELARRLSGKRRSVLTRLSTEELVSKGTALYQAQQTKDAVKLFAEALKRNDLTDELRCRALFYQGDSYWKLRDRPKSAPILDQAIAACDKTELVELQVRAAYQAGRSYDKLDDEETSIARLKLIEEKHAQHSYADDARLRQAESYKELGRLEEMRAVLASIPESYPNGDMKAEAMWRLAWSAYKSGDFDGCVGWLTKQIEVEPIADYWARAGQAQYWIARSLTQLGKPGEAVDYYRQTIRLYPLSYYSLLALNRLRESHPDVFEQMKVEIAMPSKDDGAFVFAMRDVYASDGFRRALEFLRLGLVQASYSELRRIGFRVPPGKKRLQDEEEIERTWVFAYLTHYARQYDQSHWPTRWHVLDYKRHWPVGSWRAKWRIAYPKAYWDLLDKHATSRGLPTTLLIAHVREESAFNPNLESWANAIGLTQMILPTARHHVKGMGFKATRENLRDPEKNVIVGANFLKSLQVRWNGAIAYMVPSYNTGQGRVARWLKDSPGRPKDEFAEDIYFDEPRRYNKRVTESYFVYTYLGDGSIPVMPN